MPNHKAKMVFGILLPLLLTSCFKTHKYKFTSKICDNLFVEVYEVNSFGVNADYLTDSLHFYKYIDDWDDEHETILYGCAGDSVRILKTVRGNRWARWDTTSNGTIRVVSNLDTLENFSLSISQLKKRKDFK